MRQKDKALHTKRKSEILRAAAECFAKSGLHSTSMKTLCQTVGMSPGSLYRYFPSKAAIIGALAAEEASDNDELLAHLEGRTDVLEALLEAVPSILEVICQPTYGRLATEITAEAIRAPDGVRGFVDAERKLQDGLAEAIKRGQAAGTITRQSSADVLAQSILALFDGISTACAFLDEANPKDYVLVVSGALTGMLKDT